MSVSQLPSSNSKDIRVPRSRSSKNSKFTKSFAIVDDEELMFNVHSEFGPNQDQFYDTDYTNNNDQCRRFIMSSLVDCLPDLSNWPYLHSDSRSGILFGIFSEERW